MHDSPFWSLLERNITLHNKLRHTLIRRESIRDSRESRHNYHTHTQYTAACIGPIVNAIFKHITIVHTHCRPPAPSRSHWDHYQKLWQHGKKTHSTFERAKIERRRVSEWVRHLYIICCADYVFMILSTQRKRNELRKQRDNNNNNK